VWYRFIVVIVVVVVFVDVVVFFTTEVMVAVVDGWLALAGGSSRCSALFNAKTDFFVIIVEIVKMLQ